MRDEHLDEATWERLAMRELDAEARGRALAHVNACECCMKIYRGLLLLKAEAKAIDPGVSK
jgi:hypothetical protein